MLHIISRIAHPTWSSIARVLRGFKNRSTVWASYYLLEFQSLIFSHIELANLKVTEEELTWLGKTCPFLPPEYLTYLGNLTLTPKTQVELIFHPENDSNSDSDIGSVELHVKGLWVETILYEIPLLALISETYFRFIDTDWSYDGQLENAREKGRKLLQAGCAFSEFGSRRRRDYKTHELVVRGLVDAAREGKEHNWPGTLTGTSNVHFAMKFDLTPIGTVAHEWFMGVAAITDDYENANELALKNWVGTFGPGTLSIALTDTFGTRSFLEAFRKPMVSSVLDKTYASEFTGVRQDSGDPKEFVKIIRAFYDSMGIGRKVLVFSDSLNVERCLEYKKVSEDNGFTPSFGVGTFMTSKSMSPNLENSFFWQRCIDDFTHLSNSQKSVPLNIVIKLASAHGNPAIKISDNIGKNTGDKDKVAEVKRRLGYVEKDWAEGDESKRWGAAK